MTIAAVLLRTMVFQMHLAIPEEQPRRFPAFFRVEAALARLLHGGVRTAPRFHPCTAGAGQTKRRLRPRPR